MEYHIWYTKDIMTTFNVIELILAMTIIGLVAIVLAPVASLLVQSSSATTDVMAKTVGGEEASNTTGTNTTSNSNTVVGSLFLSGEDRVTSFKPINKTYTELSYIGNRTIIPPHSTAIATINATERGNLTFIHQSNGITLVEGRGILMTKAGSGGNNSSSAEQQENATVNQVSLNGVRPQDPMSSTGVAFFRTNSTSHLAFLDKIIAVYQVKASPEGTSIRMREWKGADPPFVNEDIK